MPTQEITDLKIALMQCQIKLRNALEEVERLSHYIITDERNPLRAERDAIQATSDDVYRQWDRMRAERDTAQLIAKSRLTDLEAFKAYADRLEAERDKLREELANATWENNRKLTARVRELEAWLLEREEGE